MNGIQKLTKTETEILKEIAERGQTTVFASGDKGWSSSRRIDAVRKLRDAGIVTIENLGTEREMKRGAFGRQRTGHFYVYTTFAVRMAAK